MILNACVVRHHGIVCSVAKKNPVVTPVKFADKMMRALYPIIAYLPLLLNISYVALVAFIINRYDTFDEQKERFESFMPFSHGIVVLLLVLLSIFSLIVLARKTAVFPKILAGLQGVFILIYIWQFL